MTQNSSLPRARLWGQGPQGLQLSEPLLGASRTAIAIAKHPPHAEYQISLLAPMSGALGCSFACMWLLFRRLKTLLAISQNLRLGLRDLALPSTTETADLFFLSRCRQSPCTSRVRQTPEPVADALIVRHFELAARCGQRHNHETHRCFQGKQGVNAARIHCMC